MGRYENMTFVQEYANILILLFTILLTAHFLACLWYFVGLDISDGPSGEMVHGWVHREFSALKPPR
jgi:hypothetical protein